MIKVDIVKELHAGNGRIALQLKFDIADGELLALYGASGSGKTSMMRIIAGLLKPDKGTIEVDGAFWFDSNRRINESPQRRDVGVVFQEYALFPNMTVRENIAFGLKKDQSTDSVDEIIKHMELQAMAHVRPGLLSGGQKQRVALARAIVRRPKVLLLDEPTSALDAALRARVQQYIRSVHEKQKMTTLLITHDMIEVARLADRVVAIEQGAIKAEGTPVQVLPLNDLRSLLQGMKHSPNADSPLEAGQA